MSNEIADRKFLSEERFEWLIFFCCQLVFIGFVSSRALTSIGMMAILVLSLLHNGIPETFKKYFEQKQLVVLSVFFWIVFLSGIYSEDKTSWLNWVRIKLPYVALPLAFASVRKLKEKKFIAMLYGFVITMFVSVVVVLVNYFINYETITESFLRGNTMPMPFSHIRYTLMVAFAFFICLFLWHKRKFFLSETENRLQVFIALFLFVALHVLSVRSSLLAVYLGIFYLVLRYIFSGNKMAGTALLIGLITVPPVAVKFIPSLHNKLEYMHYDRMQFEKGEINNLSDAVRVLSMQGAWQIGKRHWLLGVGAGDLKSEMENFYHLQYPQLPFTDHKLPHNEWLWVFATLGTVGLLLFAFAFFFSLFINENYRHSLLVMLYIIIASSFFTEATLEEQMGTGFFVLLLLLLLNQQHHE